MKRLANLKNSASTSGAIGSSKRNQQPPYGKSKKSNVAKNNPYSISGKSYLDPPVTSAANGHPSYHTPPSGRSISYASPSQSKTSIPISADGQHSPTMGNKSTAPTVSTHADTVSSDAAHSKAGTTVTFGGAVSSSGVGGGEGSTFSSPAPSVRSMTTTLTTIQSAAPSTLLAAPNQGHQGQHGAGHHNHQSSATSHFTHQFPSSPVSAIPPYLNAHASGGHPATYNTATANSLLSDNASVMTLASSSKRRRRNSLDTNASVRALAPSSLYGGSKESLPLSVLSANHNVTDQASVTGPQHPPRTVSLNPANTERASVYSSSGIAPALPSERNSYYAAKQSTQTDGASVRSGRLGHSRNDSITRSVVGLAGTDSPLNGPREVQPYGKLSRQNSCLGEVVDDDLSVRDNHSPSKR